MAEKFFSSEEAQIRSLLDEDDNYPLLSKENPVIFHNEHYEQHLLMSFNMDWGTSSRMAKEEPSDTSGPLHLSPQGSNQRYQPYYIETTSSRPRNSRNSSSSSNTKMADYARRYREMKKQQLATAEIRLQVLEDDNQRLKEERARMVEALAKANQEIRSLKNVIDQDSSIAKVISDRFAYPGQLDSLSAGVCLHIGTDSTTIEVCDHCTRSAEEKAASKVTNSDFNNLDLFNGDFSTIEQFVQ